MADIHGVPNGPMTGVQGFTSAPLEDVTSEFNAATSLAAPGGPRQGETLSLLESPAGAGAVNVISGFPDYESADVLPPELFGTDQGRGPYPGTT